MSKKNVLNIILLVGTYFFPLYFLYLQKEVTISVGFIWFGLLFFGSALLTYLNNKYRKKNFQPKWLWSFFMILGIIGLCYSGFILWILLIYKDCCGF